jgi:phage baseplate assembly protein W
MQLGYPYHIGHTGRTDHDEGGHARDLIEQVLFTTPSERVNRPDFGAGVLEMVFAGESDELLSAGRFLIQGALQQWLGDLIEVEAVNITREDARLSVVIQYRERRTQERRADVFWSA